MNPNLLEEYQPSAHHPYLCLCRNLSRRARKMSSGSRWWRHFRFFGHGFSRIRRFFRSSAECHSKKVVNRVTFCYLEVMHLYGFIGKLYFKRTGRILGCQSNNHSQCKGELWTCERCEKRICWEEGSEDLPEICDDCWIDVRELGQPWKNPSRWNDETI